MIDLNEIAFNLEKCRTTEVINLVTAAAENYSIEKIIREGLYPGIIAAEKRFQKNEILVLDLLTTERALNQSIKVLRLSMQKDHNSQWGKIITGTLKGDVREWEKNLISVLIQAMGINVMDLGVSVPVESYANAAMNEDIRMIVCSTALTTHMPQMKYLVQALHSAKLRDRVKVLFSGGPVTELLCQGIGADFYAPDSVSAAEMAAEYCKNEPNFSEKQAV
jgi:methanogenic corrinoid protein MtbC1